MPVSRLTAEGLAAPVAAAYGRAELRLLRLMAKHLRAGHDAPQWAERKLAELQLYRKRADRIMRTATSEAVDELGRVTTTAYLRGAAGAELDLLRAGLDVDAPPRQAERAVEALVRAEAGQLEDIGPRVVRQAEDAYRDAVVKASTGTLSGAATRLDDAAAAVDDLARRGLSGFTDTRGRQWGLESYVDMATRTTTAQAAVAGSLDRLSDGGIELVMVSDSPRECGLCRPWEGAVLSRGPLDVLQTNVRTGELERVDIDGTVAGAVAAGLLHPNCTHNLSGYIHGATKRHVAPHNPEGYEAQQRQRAMERTLREWKRREAAALTPELQRRAAAKVRHWQAAIREHVATHDLPRKPHRESLDVAPRPQTGLPRDRDTVNLRTTHSSVIETAMADLMSAGDYGPRFEQLADEMDRRDADTSLQLLGEPDPLADKAALHRLMFGDHAEFPQYRRRTARDRERELRDEYDAWVHTQWLRAEADCRGHLLTNRGQHEVEQGRLDVRDFFTRRRRSLELASDELQEWFAQPGNQRLSFPEFRAGLMDDQKARDAQQRMRSRGWESEWG